MNCISRHIYIHTYIFHKCMLKFACYRIESRESICFSIERKIQRDKECLVKYCLLNFLYVSLCFVVSSICIPYSIVLHQLVVKYLWRVYFKGLWFCLYRLYDAMFHHHCLVLVSRLEPTRFLDIVVFKKFFAFALNSDTCQDFFFFFVFVFVFKINMNIHLFLLC